MPAFKSLLLSFVARPAGKLRHCAHDRTHEIRKGELVLEVATNPGTAGYCVNCAAEMIRRAQAALADVRVQLSGSSAGV